MQWPTVREEIWRHRATSALHQSDVPPTRSHYRTHYLPDQPVQPTQSHWALTEQARAGRGANLVLKYSPSFIGVIILTEWRTRSYCPMWAGARGAVLLVVENFMKIIIYYTIVFPHIISHFLWRIITRNDVKLSALLPYYEKLFEFLFTNILGTHSLYKEIYKTQGHI